LAYFWNDFVSSAQASQSDGAIFLAGLPRIAATAHAAARRSIWIERGMPCASW